MPKRNATIDKGETVASLHNSAIRFYTGRFGTELVQLGKAFENLELRRIQLRRTIAVPTLFQAKGDYRAVAKGLAGIHQGEYHCHRYRS